MQIKGVISIAISIIVKVIKIPKGKISYIYRKLKTSVPLETLI